jgi:subtilisin family serine protease
MRQAKFSVPGKSSISLASLLGRKAGNLRPTVAARSAGFSGGDVDRIHETDLTSVIVEADDLDSLLQNIGNLQPTEKLEKLSGEFLSGNVSTDTVARLVNSPHVLRIQSKKRSIPHLDEVFPDIGLTDSVGGSRVITEDGTGVLIGIIDSGFDLSHPAFRDDQNRLRVLGLLDQTNANREYTTAQLESSWSSGSGPGNDEDGHGTHVASIAGGTRFLNYEGIAPGAKFLLVKTDFVNTDDAVSFLFRKANGTPCVINLSLGHHWGSHDGTDVEERLHRRLSGSGKVIVVAAGNERTDNLHLGGFFFSGQSEEVTFDVLRQPNDPPFATITLWYDQSDSFELSLITPSGQQLPQPAMGTIDNYQSSILDLEIGVSPYLWSNSVQTQMGLNFRAATVRDRELRNWKLRLTARHAVIGRLDGWVHNSGFAVFRDHPLIEEARTIGLPATGDGCLAVASHISRASWNSDLGTTQDDRAVLKRFSPFSSLGPTRDGRWKPDISAPGQYVTAALADGSEMSGWDDRALVNQRALTIEGTSMASPVVCGVVALMLQKKPTLNLAEVHQILTETARHDAHTGPALWNPVYGFGKVDVAAALAKI